MNYNYKVSKKGGKIIFEAVFDLKINETCPNTSTFYCFYLILKEPYYLLFLSTKKNLIDLP